LILLSVPPLGGYNYITPRRAGLSATGGLSCLHFPSTDLDLLTSKFFPRFLDTRVYRPLYSSFLWLSDSDRRTDIIIFVKNNFYTS